MRRANRSILKRSMDISISGALLLCALPLMAMITLILAIDHRGNPFFVQWRTGLNGKKFRMVKFRTMSSPLEESEKPAYVSSEEGKVTRIGRFLRQTSLDELPQLAHVLTGEMSLVGPRPQPVNHLAYYGKIVEDYERRHSMKPGLTGLVQITPLRYRTHTLEHIGERVQCDLYYIDHWSIGLDVKILWKTFIVVMCTPLYDSEDPPHFAQASVQAES